MTIIIQANGESLHLTDRLELWLLNDYRRAQAFCSTPNEQQTFLQWLEGEIEQSSLARWHADTSGAAHIGRAPVNLTEQVQVKEIP